MRLSHDSIVISAALLEQALPGYPRYSQLYLHGKLLGKDALGFCPDSAGNDI
jgi:hypothetical protein